MNECPLFNTFKQLATLNHTYFSNLRANLKFRLAVQLLLLGVFFPSVVARLPFLIFLNLQGELKDEAEKPSESAEKSDKTETTEKVKKEGAEASEREEENEEGGEAKTAQAGNSLCQSETKAPFHRHATLFLNCNLKGLLLVDYPDDLLIYLVFYCLISL